MNFRPARATWQNLVSFKNWGEKKLKRGQGDNPVVKMFTTQHRGLGLEAQHPQEKLDIVSQVCNGSAEEMKVHVLHIVLVTTVINNYCMLHGYI